MNRLLFFVAVLLFLGIFSCLNTPQDRIEKNKATYQHLPESHKIKIRHGNISYGMSPDAVKLAWGEPQKLIQSGQNGKRIERWFYNTGGYSFSLGVGRWSGMGIKK